jgi:hypothetical protein
VPEVVGVGGREIAGGVVLVDPLDEGHWMRSGE